MNKSLLFIALATLLCSAVITDATPAAKPITVPLKPDPPLSIDGNLNDWSMVPDKITMDTKNHVTYQPQKWKNANDLSATVQLAWRSEALFVAANVTDDVFQQTQRASNLWKGDHLELYLDTTPDTDPTHTLFEKRQFEIGLSPGNFRHTGDALTDIPPEAYVFLPAGTSAEGTHVAAQRTAHGYTIEASIPWTLFNFKPQIGLPLGLEFAVSDTDNQEASQGKMLTIGTANWNRNRGRLLRAVLAPADGKAPASITNTPLFQNKSVPLNQTATITFDAPNIPDGYQAVLSLQARLNNPKLGGYTQAMLLTLNGKAIGVDRLLNKKQNEMMADGRILGMAAGDKFTVPVASNFTETQQSKIYALKNAQAPLFEFRISDLLKPTGNVLKIKNAPRHDADKALILRDANLLYRIPSAPKVLIGPPTDALPIIAPQPVQPVKYHVTHQSNGQFSLAFNGKTYRVNSQYSTPAGKWVNDSNSFFTVKRQIKQNGESIVVRDTFTNLTDGNLPLMHREEVQMKPDKLWLGGLTTSSTTGTSSSNSNPTVFAVQGNTGIGLLPLDDVFQVHIKDYSTGKAIGLADDNLIIKPKSTYTAEWAIVPISTANYFDFINATRRLLDVNFTVDGSFAFLRADPNSVGKWSDQKLTDFVHYKDVKYLCLGPNYPRYEGMIAQGTQVQKMDLSSWKTAIALRRRLFPEVKQLAYFHSFLDVAADAPEEYHDSQLTLANGKQGDYGKSAYKLFVPTLTDSYGTAVAKNIDLILDDMKLDGVYWDEFQKSRYDYSYNENQWDGCSADIDPTTMQITKLKSSVTLLSLPWRLEQAKRILKNHVLITNGGTPYTKAMRALHHAAFTETGSITNIRNAQLYTPIALGDHLSERSEEDVYRVMLNALDYNALYYWYNDMTVIPTYHTLTQYMFPFTPIELHQGCVIGKERIITKRSGLFGWNDDSVHEVHVYNNSGREVDLKNIKAPTVVKTYEKDGKSWTELRIGEGWSAAIVRKVKN